MKILFAALLAAASLYAAVDGTVMNGTTGRPQPGATVTLVNLGGAGMQPQGSARSDQAGKFHFDQTPQGMALVQADYQGVTYTLMLQPGAPTSGLALQVFDASATPGNAKVTEDVIILEPAGPQLNVRQNIIWQNGGKQTFRDPGGTLHFYAPAEGKSSLRVSATPPGGLPLEQPVAPAGAPNAFKVDFAIKPGETTFEIGYTVPLSSPGSFSGRTLQKDAPLRLAVPSGVTLKGEGLTLLGQDPQSKASVYGLKSQEFKVDIEGTGSMASAAPASGEGSSDNGLDQILPRVYDSVYEIVGLGLAILALGFVLLYRMKASTTSIAQDRAGPRSRPLR